MNKKGVVIESAILGGLAFLMVISAIALTPSHRVRKAVEKCEATEPAGTDCKAFVDKVKADGGLSGAKPEYIRDI